MLIDLALDLIGYGVLLALATIDTVFGTVLASGIAKEEMCFWPLFLI